MQVRRNDLDVTSRIQTTAPDSIKTELCRLFRLLYPGACHSAMDRAFHDLVSLYRGEYPGYLGCETAYHDLQHIMDVTLAMARLMDGYERSRGNAPALGVRLFQLGIILALFHDVGYLRKVGDRKKNYGAQYTPVHVSRGARFLKTYLPEIGFAELATAAAQIIHFTGYEKPVASIRLRDPLQRLLGRLLGTADLIAQMADRCYLEKCRNHLYPELVAGGRTRKIDAQGKEQVLFASGEDLIHKTPVFFEDAMQRLNVDLGGVHQYAATHFGGNNLYIEAAKKNVNFARQLSLGGGNYSLRRSPPESLPGKSKK